MKLIAINGSPRKEWNTATLLKNVIEGASRNDMDLELINLYDFNFKGCISCFSCKRNNSKNYGICSLNDDLKPILSKIRNSDALVIGTPIYFETINGVTSCFLERFLFQNILYTLPPTTSFKGNLKIGIIYTMNITEDEFLQNTISKHLKNYENYFKLIFGNIETYYCFDTYQIDNYSNIDYTYFDKEKKKKRREDRFAIDCEKVYEMGERLFTK